MKFYSLIFPMLQGVLIWSALFSVLQNASQQKGRLILEKCLYETSSGSDGMLRREHKLRSITTYDKKGQMIKDVIFSDYISCNTYSELYNRPKTSFSFWYDYQYNSNQLVQVTYRECDSLTHIKKFYSYKFNQLNQVSEKQELIYYFKRHEMDLSDIAIGDSILKSKNITIYKYDLLGNTIEEIISNTVVMLYPKPEISEHFLSSDTIIYQFDSNNKLRSRKSILSDAIQAEEYEYEYEDDKLVRSRNGLSSEIIYSYNAKGLLILEVMKIPNDTDFTYQYFYNEEDLLIRVEKFNGYDLNIEEYEYTYYE